MRKPKIHATAKIHPTAVIYDNVTIGADVEIGPHCIIGAPGESERFLDKYIRWGVTIMSGTKLMGLVTIDAGTERETIIGKGCFFMKSCHVGHDAILENGVTLSPGAKVGGWVYIGEGTNVGMNAAIHQRVSVPDGCMIGMLTAVTKKTNCKRNGVYVGTPAKWIRENNRK